MAKYVSTLLFTPDKHYVLLVQKKRGPAFIVGKWTAVGGNVEEGETLVQAAARELKEEADAEAPAGLVEFAVFSRGSDCVMFTGFLGEDEHYQPLTDEDVILLDVAGIMVDDVDADVADDTKVLIAMALHKLDGGNLFFEALEEKEVS